MTLIDEVREALRVTSIDHHALSHPGQWEVCGYPTCTLDRTFFARLDGATILPTADWEEKLAEAVTAALDALTAKVEGLRLEIGWSEDRIRAAVLALIAEARHG